LKNLKTKFMQKIFYSTAAVLTTVIFAASCTDHARLASESVQTVPVSTTEFQEFQTWKQQQLNTTTNPNTASYTAAKAPAQKVVYRERVVEKAAPAPEPVYDPIPTQPQKKGWSKAAKGTAIGAGAGAAAGALLIKKNRALGAVIGGVVGGGVGYGIGRSQDKKDGRY
jgi:hypothetical protein